MFGDKIKTGFFKKSDDSFTLTNDGFVSRTYLFLGSSWTSTAFPSFTQVDDNVILNSKEFSDYTELINDKEMTPKNIKAIRLITYSPKPLFIFQNPFIWQRRKPDGNVLSFVDFPVNLLPPDQYQNGMVDVYYKNLIIGLNEFMIYTIPAKETVNFTLIYDDFRLEKLLNRKEKQVLYSKMDKDTFEKYL